MTGSDYPFPLGEERPGAVWESMLEEFSIEEVQALAFANALDWLGLEKQQFDL